MDCHTQVGSIKSQAENLVDIDTVLGPMLAKMDKSQVGYSWHLAWPAASSLKAREEFSHGR